MQAYLRDLPIGAVFTHANPAPIPDSWVKVDTDAYRRTYDWIEFRGADLASQWSHAELTSPVPGSIDKNEARRRKLAEISRRRERAIDESADREPVDGERTSSAYKAVAASATPTSSVRGMRPDG